MYEQDYIMRINRDVIRTIAKLVLNKDTELPIDIASDTLNSEDRKTLEFLHGQVNLGSINEFEQGIIRGIENKESRFLEKALLFYTYLNEQSDEFLLSNSYSRERVESGLKFIASKLGILEIVNLHYFE